jgi:D-apiose dehydrogenase
MDPVRVGVVGCGFWSHFQVPAWFELAGAQCVAVCDTDAERARKIGERFGIPLRFSDPEELMQKVRPDVVDIVSSPGTHRELVLLAARHHLPVICQKPMANHFQEAKEMVQTCRDVGVPFFVHENWRWQRPIRELKRVLLSEEIGTPFRARIDFNTSFPVFDNEPFLKGFDELILLDLGTHLLDVARFLFGEAKSLYCETNRVHPEICGEDVATVLLRMRSGTIVTCNLSFATRTESERFPETFVLIEGNRGSVELGPDCWIRVTTEQGTFAKRYPPPLYRWADPSYGLVHSSIVACHRNLLDGLQGKAPAETPAEDNLLTLELVFGAYESARTGHVFRAGGT